MLKTLPFNALRTLEAVVRLRGFSRAADELNVTQSAVSQHIKQLEEWLGHQLLIRRSRQTVPTDVGEQLAQTTRNGFGQVEALCDALRGSQKGRTRGLLVGSPPGFAFLWLLPRLLKFDALHPDIPISLSTDPKARSPDSGDADIYISYSAGGFPNYHAERLMTEEVTPVCAPNLARTIHTVDDLRRHTILEDNLEVDQSQSHWTYWAKEVGLTLPPLPHRRKYGQANLVIQAALQGQGVAMGRSPLIADAVAAGTLIKPFAASALSQFSYWFVCEHQKQSTTEVQALHLWLQGEAATFSAATHPSP